jgi:hypothetical protein
MYVHVFGKSTKMHTCHSYYPSQDQQRVKVVYRDRSPSIHEQEHGWIQDADIVTQICIVVGTTVKPTQRETFDYWRTKVLAQLSTQPGFIPNHVN